jgi:hypothetical protein
VAAYAWTLESARSLSSFITHVKLSVKLIFELMQITNYNDSRQNIVVNSTYFGNF